jgi:L-iditol 2-dehydrogenase
MTALPDTVRAAVWHGPGRMEIEPWPLPEVGSTDVLVRVQRCGVCGSDLHVLDGDLPEFVPPRVLGHEPLGVVESVGDAVADFRPGETVTWEPSLPCGACFYCHAGEDGLCERRVRILGAFAERTVVPARALYSLPPDLSASHGVLAEPLSCALYAHERGQVHPGDSVAVVGAGTIGLLLIALARRAGAGLILVSDLNPRKRALALELGADIAIDPQVEQVEEVARRVTGGRGVEVAFEAVGAPAAVADALAAPRPGGRVALVGLSGPSAAVTVPLLSLLRRDLVVHAVWMRKFTFQRAVELLPVLPLERIVTHTLPLDRIDDAFALLRSGEAVKVVVEP